MVRRCWVNFQCRGVLRTWITVGQGPIVLALGAGGGCLDIFSLIYHFSSLSPSLWERARYRLKYCLKGPLSPKQPTNQRNESMLPDRVSNSGPRTTCQVPYRLRYAARQFWQRVIQGTLRNCEMILKSSHWPRSRCCLEVYLFLALVAILCNRADPF